MLLVVFAQATIVRAAVMGSCVEMQRCFGRLVVVADVFIIGYIGGNQHFFKAMQRTGFKHINLLVFEHNFGIYPAAGRCCKC